MGIGSSWLVISSSVSAAPCRPAGSFLGFPTWYKYYILSQGSPDKTKQALSTIISAIVGLVITIIAATIVSFVAGSFSNTAAPTSTPNTNQNGPR
ncbi:hypothetical protein EB118_12875 [bacterium]|nr:hypothetical protein [bacterium]